MAVIKPKIITCTGYYNTGSSAVGDFLRQFENIQAYGDYEIRIAHEPDGISDLEYNVVNNNHRHNTSNAIKRFLTLCKYYNGNIFSKRYRNVFGNDFYISCKKYIESITQLKCKSWWQFDQIYRGRLIYFLDVLYSHIYKKIHFWKDPSQIRETLFFNDEMGYFTYLNEKEFIEKTRTFTDELIQKCWDQKSQYIVLDQLVPPTNIERYKRYFSQLKVIVVERDPRDVYLLEIENPYGVVPTKVEEYCKWYRIIRQHRRYEHMNSDISLMIRFEDMIYKYKETAEIICKFVGIEYKDIKTEYSSFNPSVSQKNTRLWERDSLHKDAIGYIECNLKEYLYNYDLEG